MIVRRTTRARLGAGLLLAAAVTLGPAVAQAAPAPTEMAPMAGGICNGPQISVTASEVAVGEPVTISGECFAADTEGTIRLITPDGPRPHPVRTDLDGSVSESYSFDSPGAYSFIVEVDDVQRDGGFTVVDADQDGNEDDDGTDEDTDAEGTKDEGTENEDRPDEDVDGDGGSDEDTAGDDATDEDTDVDDATDENTDVDDVKDEGTENEDRPDEDTAGDGGTDGEVDNGTGTGTGTGTGQGDTDNRGDSGGSGMTERRAAGTAGGTGSERGGDGAQSERTTATARESGATSAPTAADAPAPSSAAEQPASRGPAGEEPEPTDVPSAAPQFSSQERQAGAFAALVVSLLAHGVSGGEVGTSPAEAAADGEAANSGGMSGAGASDGGGVSDGGGEELARTGVELSTTVTVTVLALLGGVGLLRTQRRREH